MSSNGRSDRFGIFPAEVIAEHGANVGATAIAVYAVLATYADEQGMCYPGMQTIASLLGATRQTIHTALKALEREGLVTVVAPSKEDQGKRETNRYILPHVAETRTCLKIRHVHVQKLDTVPSDVSNFLPDVSNFYTRRVQKLDTNKEINKEINRERESINPRESKNGLAHDEALQGSAPSPEPVALSLTDLPESWQKWCAKHRPDLNAEYVWSKFRAHHESMGLKYVNWFARWQKWLAAERADDPAAGNGAEAVELYKKHALWLRSLGNSVEPGSKAAQIVRSALKERALAPEQLAALKEYAR